MNCKNINITISLCCFLFIFIICGCNTKDKPTNWNVNLNRNNKNPYGLFLTYNSLPYLFPGCPVEELKSSYRLTHLSYKLRKNVGKSLILYIGRNLYFNSWEIDSLISFVNQGNQVILSANNFDDSLLSRLQIIKGNNYYNINNKVQKIFLQDKGKDTIAFSYRYYGEDISGNFRTSYDAPADFVTLGNNEKKLPNFVVFGIGEGKLFLHAAPIAFTNYFLLQENNRNYLNTLFSYVSDPVQHIYWSGANYRQIHSSDWNIIWRNPATRYALLLALFTLGVYILFQMKRRQRVIPVIPPLENSSVAFVETTGRLYYNKKNHTNLAGKMIQHFLEFVRVNYMLNTSNLDSTFTHNLAAKSGIPLTRVEQLVQHIKEIQNGAKVDPTFLYNLYKEIQLFYHGK